MTLPHTPRVPLPVTIVALVLAILGGAIGIIGLIDPALLDFGNSVTGRTWAGRTLGLAMVMLLAVVLRSRATYIAAFVGGLCRDVSDLFAGLIGDFRPDAYLAVPFILVGMISLIVILNNAEEPSNPIPVAAAAAGAGVAAATPGVASNVTNVLGAEDSAADLSADAAIQPAPGLAEPTSEPVEDAEEVVVPNQSDDSTSEAADAVADTELVDEPASPADADRVDAGDSDAHASADTDTSDDTGSEAESDPITEGGVADGDPASEESDADTVTEQTLANETDSSTLKNTNTLD